MIRHGAGIVKPLGLDQNHLQLSGGIDVYHLIALAGIFRRIILFRGSAAAGGIDEHIVSIVVIVFGFVTHAQHAFHFIKHLSLLLPMCIDKIALFHARKI